MSSGWSATPPAGVTGNYKMGSTRPAFEAATIGGAKILRRADLGRLAAGTRAGFALVDWPTEMRPTHEPIRSLIYAASDRAIRHVYVDGKQVVEDGGPDDGRRGRYRGPGRGQRKGLATVRNSTGPVGRRWRSRP